MTIKHRISFFLILFGFVALSQNVKINIAPINIHESIPRVIGLDFENYIKNMHRLECGVAYYFSTPQYSGDGEYEGLRIRMSYKLYLKKDIQYQSYFIAPSIYYLHTSVPEYDEPFVYQTKGIRNAFGFGLRFGYQKILAKRLIIGAYLNPILYYNNIYKEFDDGSKQDYYKNTFEVEIGVCFGFIFGKLNNHK